MHEWATKKEWAQVGPAAERLRRVRGAEARLARGAPRRPTALWKAAKDGVENAIRIPASRSTSAAPQGAPRRRVAARAPAVGPLPLLPAAEVADDGQISYMGVNQYTRQWKRIKTYGGKLIENADQAERATCSRPACRWIEAARLPDRADRARRADHRAPDDAMFTPTAWPR
jgi:DNA polymerase